MRSLIEQYIFNPAKDKAKIYQKVKKQALKRGIFLSSLFSLYKEIAAGNISGFCVPAFNIRTLTFDIAKAVFRAAKKEKANAFILEIACSEMDYTNQTPQEYSLCCLAAALEEKFQGQVFLQGDHFYLNEDTDKAILALENLITQALLAGFYNFDIDCSALNITANIQRTIHLAHFVKNHQPLALSAVLGGEVSAIGSADTTPEQLENFLKATAGEIMKVSCQFQTRHGGKISSLGEVAKIEIDVQKLKTLNNIARDYGLAGVVQHGASTLPQEQFAQLVKAGILEVHLSTLFQNIFFESPYLPPQLKEKMYAYLLQHFPEEQKRFASETQFLYALRKKALGIFKKEIWQMPPKNINGICEALEEKFRFFFKVFNVNNTQELIKKLYT